MASLLRTILGLAVVLLGVCSARRPDLFLPLLPSELRVYLLQVRGIKAFSFLPPTFAASIALITVGILLLLPSRGPSEATTESLPINEFPIRTKHIVWACCLMAVSLGGSFTLEHYKILGLPWVSAAFVAILALSILHSWWEDRRCGTSPHFGLSFSEIASLAVFSSFLFAYYVQELHSWRYSYIGDEYGFFWYAQGLINRSLKEASLLEASGCFEFFPMFTSWWQTWFMRALGPTNFAWRASMAAITALSAPAFYILLKVMLAKLGKRAWIGAGVGTIALYLSEFTIVWARIGKPHAVFLPPVVFAAAFMMLAIRQGSRTFLQLAGISAGLGMFLSSLGPVIALGTIAIMLTLWKWPLSVRLRRTLWPEFIAPGLILLIAFVLTAAPIIVQADYWERMLFVNLGSPEAKSNLHLFLPKFISSVFLPLDFITAAHFLSGNVVDPIVAALCFIGLVGARLVGWQPILLGAAIHTMIAYVVGAKSQYSYPPPTRMQLDIFPVAIMAGIGISVLLGRARKVAALTVVALLVWSGAYSWVKLQDYNPYQFPIHVNAGFLKALQESPQPDNQFILVLPKGVYRNFFEHYNATFEHPFSLNFVDASADVPQFVESAARAAPGKVAVLLPDVEENLLPAIQSIPSGPLQITIVPMRTMVQHNPLFDSPLTAVFLPIIEFFEGMGRAT